MIRAFVAISLPDVVLQRLEEIALRLKRMGLEGSYPRKESIHLTLKFLGDVDETQIPAIGAALERSVEGIASFSLQVRRVGVFPRLSEPRIVWVGVDVSQTLRRLHGQLESQLTPLGFPPESRGFQPHLTLLRLKSRDHVKSLIDWIREEGGPEDAGAFEVQSLHLYQSVLRPEGARYTRLRTVALK